MHKPFTKSSVHSLLVNILRCVRLYIKRKYYIIIKHSKTRARDSMYTCPLRDNVQSNYMRLSKHLYHGLA